MQFEELFDPKGLVESKVLTNLYDEYLETWVGEHWLQPKYLPEGFKVRNLRILPRYFKFKIDNKNEHSNSFFSMEQEIEKNITFKFCNLLIQKIKVLKHSLQIGH